MKTLGAFRNSESGFRKKKKKTNMQYFYLNNLLK